MFICSIIFAIVAVASFMLVKVNAIWFFLDEQSIFVMLFLSAFVPFMYILFDFIYGFTVKNIGREELTFNIHKLPNMMWLSKIMWAASDRMDLEVELFLEKSDKIRIYSMGSRHVYRVYISLGLITYITSKANDDNEKNRLFFVLFCNEIANLKKYNFVPNMINKAGDRLAKFAAIIAMLPMRILLIPIFLVPFLRQIAIYFTELAEHFVYFVEKIVYKVAAYVYDSLRKSFIDKKIEYENDLYTISFVEKDWLIMLVALLKNRNYHDGYSMHTAAINRIKNIDKMLVDKNSDNSEQIIVPGMIFCCFGFVFSSFFAINAQIWLFPVLVMENMILVHHFFVFLSSKVSFATDVLSEAYHLLSLSFG